MATWQAWSESIAIGSLVTKAVMDQIHNNLDYMEENTVCVTHDATFQSAYDVGHDVDHYGTNEATHYGTDDALKDSTYNNALLTTDEAGHYTSQLAIHYGTNDSGDYTTLCGTYYVSRLNDQHTSADSHKYTTVETSNQSLVHSVF